MIFLSILAKTLALALFGSGPWWPLALWLASLAIDFRVVRRGAAGAAWLGPLAWWNASALVIGAGTVAVCGVAAMRWKEGIPVFASMVETLLGCFEIECGRQGGNVVLTTMAGPLEFAASIDGMALTVPLVMLALCVVWCLWAGTPVRETVRRAGMIVAILCVVAVVRMAGVVLLANGLFEFTGYETEELPWRPFMDQAAAVAMYVPFLLLAGMLVGRHLAVPSTETAASRPPLPWKLRLAALGGMAVLVVVVFWQPAGTLKTGKLVISSHRAQWSPAGRPYDREWYGADSGYNYACLKRLFEAFYPVEEAKEPLTAKVLEGAATLLIYDPDQRFTKEEREVVQDFVRGGGGLLVIGDHTNVFGSASHMNELCEPFGFQFRDDVLFDLDEDFHQLIDPPVPGNRFWHGMSFFKLRGPASIRATSWWTRSIYQVGHSKSVRAIYSVNNFYPPPHDDPKMTSGTFCVSAASRHGSGRVVAWGDSTVFSNFEVFYPGKYEYLLNAMHWLNHRDSLVLTVGQRLAAVVLAAGLAGLLWWRREPREWLLLGTGLVAVCGAAWWAGRLVESATAEFPQPVKPSEWVFFHAHPDDAGHHLRDFITEVPYDQRYEVFVQWVLRTGAFAAYHVGGPKAVNGLHEHLLDADATPVARALIVRTPEDLGQLDELAAVPARAGDPVLLMFGGKIGAEQAIEGIRRAGLVKAEASITKIGTAWPTGEALVEDPGGRRVMVVAGAERFSDQAMGISEKVVPDAAQRAVFDQAFGVIDRLFGKPANR